MKTIKILPTQVKKPDGSWLGGDSIGFGGGSGIPSAVRMAIGNLLLDACYNSTNHSSDKAIIADWMSDEPEQPTRTLQSISAVYSGGEVEAGTHASDLIGIVVKAHYNLTPLTETVTGWTISGTVEEGSNTFTIYYEGKTATITVVGYVSEKNYVLDEDASNWDYTIYDNKCLLTGYSGNEESIIIPRTLNVGGTVKNVVISYDPQNYGNAKNIDFGNAVCWSNSIPRLDSTYGTKVKEIKGLSTLEVRTGGVITPTSISFDGYTSLEKIVDIPSSVVSLNGNALRNTSIKNIDAFSNVTTINQGLIFIKTLVNVNLPTTLTSAYRLLYDCVAKSVTFRSDVDDTQFGYNLNKDCIVNVNPNLTIYKRMQDTIANTNMPYCVNNERRSIYCYGDSLTYGSGASTGAGEVLDSVRLSYPYYLSKKTGNIVASHSHGGVKTDVICSYVSDVKQPESWIHDSIHIIWAGTNGHNGDPITLLNGILPQIGNYYLFIPPVYSGYDASYDQLLVSTYGNNHVLSLHDYFDARGINGESYLTDGTHFNSEGYEKVAEAVAEKLESLGWLTK